MKLTPAQASMLRKVVATNGGGVFAGFHERGRTAIMLRKLEALGLVQGKRGEQSCAVHTRAGLDWVRANPPKS